MPREVIGKIPDFTPDETQGGEKGIKEVKEAPAEEVVEKEKATPTELPAEIKPDSAEAVDDTSEVVRQKQGLLDEREKLLQEITQLRGLRRDLKQQEIQRVEQKIDELKDLHPDDVAVVDRILRQRGYITKDEAGQMFYNAVKSEEVSSFLEKYPEYKPENDPNDVHWLALQQELQFYRSPEDPHKIGEVLARAHRSILRPVGGQSAALKQKQIDTASLGSGGKPRPSSVNKDLPPNYRRVLEDGGWSEEDIKKIEQSY